MNFKKILSSRTNWTILVIFLIGGVESITAFIPIFWLPFVEGILALAALYFHTHPKVDFSK